jgi:spore coat polysaccharide biosynthesis predicted glycosyltransferase SpsG
MRVAFLVDAGAEVGWGHLVRCQALAVELEQQGAQVELWVNGGDLGFPEAQLRKTGESAGGTGMAAALLERNDVVVLDLFQPSRVHLAAGGPCLVVCIWDSAGEPDFPCDVLVDPNLSAAGRSPRPPGVVALQGAEYVVLRPQFDRPEPRRITEEANELLVAFGGTPRPALIQSLQKLLARAPAPLCRSLTLVAGVGEVADFHAGGAGWSMRCQVLTGVTDMRAVMARADFAFLAAGTMMYEACATGLPSLVVSLNEGQAREAAAFADRGAVRYLGGIDQASEARVYQGLFELRPRRVREELARRAREVLDGGGRRRVVEAIAAARAQRSAADASCAKP